MSLIAYQISIPVMIRGLAVLDDYLHHARTDQSCALCGQLIENGYVRDSHTRLIYCDTQCLSKGSHETISLLFKTLRDAIVACARKPQQKWGTTDLPRVAFRAAGFAYSPKLVPAAIHARWGAALKAGDKIVGAIGVGCSLSGVEDESCAEAGVDKIKKQLP